jgi:hypothetical protein
MSRWSNGRRGRGQTHRPDYGGDFGGPGWRAALAPCFEHLRLMERAASACRALAKLVDANRQRQATFEIPPQRKQASAAVAAMRQEHRATPMQPTWPTRGDRALAELKTEIATILEIATSPFIRPPDTPPLPLDRPRLGHPLRPSIQCAWDGSHHGRSAHRDPGPLQVGRPPRGPSRRGGEGSAGCRGGGRSILCRSAGGCPGVDVAFLA